MSFSPSVFPSVPSSYRISDFLPLALYSTCHKCILRTILLLWLTAYNMSNQAKNSLLLRGMEHSTFFPFQYCLLSEKYMLIKLLTVGCPRFCNILWSGHFFLQDSFNPHCIMKLVLIHISVQEFLLFLTYLLICCYFRCFVFTIPLAKYSSKVFKLYLFRL